MPTSVAVKLSYNLYESKEGSNLKLSPVILLHGISVVKEMWDDIPQRIADRTKRKVYTYDARNHGESEYTHGFSYELNVDDLFHFMDMINTEKAILIGHSMGGHTAILAALRRPERVEMIFSEDMYVKRLAQPFIDLFIPALLLRKESVQSIPDGLNHDEAVKFSLNYTNQGLPEVLRKPLSEDERSKAKTLLKKKHKGGYELAFNVEAIIDGLKTPENLMNEPTGQYNGPAYFLYGSKSPLRVNIHEEHIKKHFPKAELIEFFAASHDLHTEFPDKFIRTIVNLIPS